MIEDVDEAIWNLDSDTGPPDGYGDEDLVTAEVGADARAEVDRLVAARKGVGSLGAELQRLPDQVELGRLAGRP